MSIATLAGKVASLGSYIISKTADVQCENKHHFPIGYFVYKCKLNLQNMRKTALRLLSVASQNATQGGGFKLSDDTATRNSKLCNFSILPPKSSHGRYSLYSECVKQLRGFDRPVRLKARGSVFWDFVAMLPRWRVLGDPPL